jgi:hypothetical protein
LGEEKIEIAFNPHEMIRHRLGESRGTYRGHTMRNVQEFRSMLSAIAYTLGEHSDGYFQMEENRGYVTEVVFNALNGSDGMVKDHPRYISPDIALTMIDYQMEDNRVVGMLLQSEAYLGTILAHYTDEGDIVRFVAIPA